VATPELLAARGVELFEVERGGDVTYHGPGQLVGYPVVDLKRHRQDLHWYLRQVEEALIVTARQWSIAGWRNPGYTGVWVGQQHDDAPALPPPTPTLTPTTHSATPRKLASIGVHARDWVTWHGFALNVATDLSYFDVMVPCGIADVVMTSMEREFGGDVEMRAVKDRVAQAFGDLFSLVPAPAPQNLIPVTG
jgi:lipoyl(octanoyl) transferase